PRSWCAPGGMFFALLLLVSAPRGGPAAADGEADAPQGRRPRPGFGPGVYKGQITPHWFHNNTRFWYRNDTRGGTRDFVLVDAERGTRVPAFDHGKLAGSLSQASGTKYQADRLPFDSIEFVDDGKAIRFVVAGTSWKCDLMSHECSKVEG